MKFTMKCLIFSWIGIALLVALNLYATHMHNQSLEVNEVQQARIEHLERQNKLLGSLLDLLAENKTIEIPKPAKPTPIY